MFDSGAQVRSSGGRIAHRRFRGGGTLVSRCPRHELGTDGAVARDVDDTGFILHGIKQVASEAQLQWFALRVKPRAERVVADVLRGKGYEYFLPMHRERRRWSDRVKTVETPLFGGYVFCRFDVQRRLPVLTSPGVLQVVSIGKVPEPIPDEEIASLKVLVDSNLAIEPWPFLSIGEKVRIVGGPLAGATGVIQSVKDRDRLVVSVTLLQRSISVVVPESCIWPAIA